jgi:hypothetical protein
MSITKMTLTGAAVNQAFTKHVSRWISFLGKGHNIPVAMPNLVNESFTIYENTVSILLIPSSATTPSP